MTFLLYSKICLLLCIFCFVTDWPQWPVTILFFLMITSSHLLCIENPSLEEWFPFLGCPWLCNLLSSFLSCQIFRIVFHGIWLYWGHLVTRLEYKGWFTCCSTVLLTKPHKCKKTQVWVCAHTHTTTTTPFHIKHIKGHQADVLRDLTFKLFKFHQNPPDIA